MHEYKYPLGNAIRKARKDLGLSQNQLAEKAGIDARTVMNIENYKGNPKMQVLYSLIRILELDANTIFYPELHKKTPAVNQLLHLISTCDNKEAEMLYSIIENILSVIRSDNSLHIK